MKSKIIVSFGAAALLLSGCVDLVPYKTEFDCKKEPGGNCKSVTENINDAYKIAGLTSDEEEFPRCVDYDIKQVNLVVKEREIGGSSNRTRNRTSKKVYYKGGSYKARSKVYIKNCADQKSRTKGTIEPGTVVELTGCNKFGWCKIKGRDGYVEAWRFRRVK